MRGRHNKRMQLTRIPLGRSTVMLKWKTKIVEQLDGGPIVRVEFFNATGDSGSAPIREAINSVLDKYCPAALVLDFSRSKYEGGDGIFGVVPTHRKPACVMAQGPCKHYVEHVLTVSGLIGLLGGRLFETEMSAVEYLKTRLTHSG